MDPVISILVVFLVLFLVWYLVGKFIQGTPHQVIGILLGVVFLVYALNRLGISSHLKL